jgi:hypothetical protein
LPANYFNGVEAAGRNNFDELMIACATPQPSGMATTSQTKTTERNGDFFMTQRKTGILDFDIHETDWV